MAGVGGGLAGIDITGLGLEEGAGEDALAAESPGEAAEAAAYPLDVQVRVWRGAWGDA